MKLIHSGIAVLIMLLLTSCGNLVNDELSDDEKIIYPETDNFGTVIGGDFSSSGKVRIQSAGNEGYFIAGTKIADDGREKLWLSYIDKNANTKWSAVLENNNTNDRLSRIEAIDSENILIFADRNYIIPDAGIIPKADVMMIKINSRNGIIWQRCIGNSKKNIIYDSVMTDDGGFLVTGITVTPAVASDPVIYTPYVIRFNSLGYIVWKKDYKIYYILKADKLFEIIRPSNIISLGNGQYLVSGEAKNPDNNKLGGFYCIIDGRIEGESDDGIEYGGGRILKSKYVKSTNLAITMLGNINNDTSIVSVIGLDSPETIPEYNILILNKEDLQVITSKSYQFSNFNMIGNVIKSSENDFILAGMINPLIGKGFYAIRFNMAGGILDLQTKYYNDGGYDFINLEFIQNIENNGMIFISRLNNPDDPEVLVDPKDLFIDRYLNTYTPVVPILKAVSPDTAVSAAGDDVIEDEDNDALIIESEVGYQGNPELVFRRY